MSSRVTIQENHPKAGPEALARYVPLCLQHRVAGLSCHLGAAILVCHHRSPVLFVNCTNKNY